MVNPFQKYLEEIMYYSWSGYDMKIEIRKLSMFHFEVKFYDTDFENEKKYERCFLTKEVSAFYAQVIEACENITRKTQTPIGPKFKMVYIEDEKNHNTIITFPI